MRGLKYGSVGRIIEISEDWCTNLGNTPVIIKYPFWQMTMANEKAVYACLNYVESFCPAEIEDRAICIDGDIGEVFTKMKNKGGVVHLMTQDERRVFLIEHLLKEHKRIRVSGIPETADEQRQLLRSLMNVREPSPISDEFLAVQDEYLKERNRERGITDVMDLSPAGSDDRLYIWQGDITTLKCDAIVNACNSQMLGCFQPMHSCIDNFIHTFTGIQLRLEMNGIMQSQGHEEHTGQAKITSGYNLPAKCILHTVGPIIQFDVTDEDKELLASCYRSCLELAAENGLESIAFCCISTGVFRFPRELAAEIAVKTVKEYLDKDSRIKKVIFNVFKDEDLRIYNKILS